MAGTVDHKELRLLVTGRSGVGKSTLVNGILGEDVYVATEAGGFKRGTRTVSGHKKIIHGVPVVIFDTPGLQEVTEDKGLCVVSIIEDMKKKCQNPTLVLYCMNMTKVRSKDEDKNAILKLTAAFGQKFWENTVLVLTFANTVLVSRRNERDEDEGPEPDSDDEDGWRVLEKKRFEGRVKKWKDDFHKFLIEEVGIRRDIVENISVVPAGDQKKTRDNYNPYRLPDRDDWLDEFWKACSLQMKDNSLLNKINKHRLLVKDSRMKEITRTHLGEDGQIKERKREAKEKEAQLKSSEDNKPLKPDLVRLFQGSSSHYMIIGTALDVQVDDLLPIPGAATNNLVLVFQRWIDSNKGVTWRKVLQVCEDYPDLLGKAKAEVEKFLSSNRAYDS